MSDDPRLEAEQPEPELTDADEAPDDEPEGPKNDVVEEPPPPDGAERPERRELEIEDDASSAPEPTSEE